MKITFVADPTTKISTGVNGEYILVDFSPDGRFETDDIALIDHLLQLGVEKAEPKAKAPSKPIASEESN